ncbi:MAG: peptidase S41, partial [Acidimicrobiia bacterium]|nr:peptidase S41 [Acidimicrobiia bacterium]
IGPVLGVDANTGAGGANVWTHDLLKQLLELPAPADKTSPYKALPGGAAMRVAIRRTLRVGARAGTPVEDLGVEPDSRWLLTRNDLLNGNADLIEHAAGLLAALPLRQLDPVAGSVSGGVRPVTLTTAAIDRVDVYVGAGAGRPFASVDVTDGTTTVNLPATAAGARFEGWSGGALAVSARLT